MPIERRSQSAPETSRTYLRLGTVLPLLPTPFLLLVDSGGVRSGTGLELLVFLDIAGLVILPVYIPLVAVTLLALWRSSWRAHALAALAVPPLAAAGWSLMHGSASRDGTTTFVVILGYAYVLVVLAGLWIGQRLRLLTLA